MEFKGTKKFNVNYHTTMHLPYKYIISDIQETDEEAEANALLISKAPEILEMLKKVLIHVDWSYEEWTSNDGQIIKSEIEQLIKEATEI